MTRKVIFILFIILESVFVNSQELKITSIKITPISDSVKHEIVFDINNEPCALIKIITAIPELYFSSNRGVEKVQKNDSIFWIWVPKGTTLLNIGVQDFPLLELKLPDAANASDLYIIKLIAYYPVTTIYRDTLAPAIMISSKPKESELYINGAYQGITPVQVNIPFKSFTCTIRKKNYVSFEEIVQLDGIKKSYLFSLKHDEFSRRTFLMLTSSINSYYTPYFGISLGKIGKTGWYASGIFSMWSINRPENLSVKNEIEIHNTSLNVSIPLSPEFYYLISENYKNYETGYRITAGVTQQLFAKGFLNLGAGFSRSVHFITVDILKYTDNSYRETDYGYLYNETFGVGVNIEGGIILRIFDHFVINAVITENFGKFPGEESVSDTSWKYSCTDIRMGLGYCF